MTLEEPMEGFPAPLDTDPGTDAADSAVDSAAGPMLVAVKEDDPVSAIAIRREILPETRQSRTHKFMIGGHEGYLTIGLFPDGRPGEIFIKMSKEGSTLSGLIQGFCRAFSLALQHGLSVRDASDRFRGMRFEPMGATNNPDIPEAASILDYVARYLQINFVERG
jgi:ribonucleoside-diphosphate reductase alpha chain